MLRLLMTLLAFAVLGLLGYGYYTQLFPKTKEYITEPAGRADIVEHVAVSGYAEPLEKRAVQPDLPQGAVVEEVFVDFNSPVKAKQPLAQLANDEQKLQLDRAKIGVATAVAAKRAAEAGLESAKQALKLAQAKEEGALKARARIREADDSTVSADSKSSVDVSVKGAAAAVAAAQSEIRRCEALNLQADQAIEAAERLVRLADIQLQRTLVVSPIDGFVLSKDVNVGDIVGRPKLMVMEGMPGAPFEIAAPLDRMQAVVKLSESDYSRVKKGQRVTFTVEAYPDEKFEGVVEQIRNAFGGDRTAVTYPTVVRFANRKDAAGEWMVRPRASISAEIHIRERKSVLAVPNAALLFAPSDKHVGDIPTIGEGEAIVWVRSSANTPSPRKIKRGITNGNFTEIADGNLKEGEPIITAEPLKTGGGFQGLPFGE